MLFFILCSYRECTFFRLLILHIYIIRILQPVVCTYCSNYTDYSPFHLHTPVFCNRHKYSIILLWCPPGHVTEFDERGLTEGSQWPQCLVVLTCPAAQRSHNFQASTDPTPQGPDAWDVALDQLCSGAARSLRECGR